MQISNSAFCRIEKGGDSSNGFIVTEGGVIVVDTSNTPGETRKDMAEMREVTGKQILFLINTHHHADHTFGNQLFSCPIIAHEECRAFMKE